MLRSSLLFQNKKNLEKDTQKQKKRLSFKEPEVEATRTAPAGSKFNQDLQPKTFSSWTSNASDFALSRSLEDLSLEDRTISIAHNIGQAFEKISPEKKRLSLVSIGPSDLLHSSRKSSIVTKEVTQDEKCASGSNTRKTNSTPKTKYKLSPEDEEYLEALSPPILNMETMNCPIFELNDSNSHLATIEKKLEFEGRVATSVQHQMQYLKFQLDHQCQQTQAALAHVQLLKDQLQAETSARYKAQVQNHQLITKNKELLNHIQSLFQQIQGLEKQVESLEKKSSNGSSSQEIQFRRRDSLTNESVFRGSGSNQGVKVNAFAPNPIIANRRSSMTGAKPFQPKTDYLDSSKKRDEMKLYIGDSMTPLKSMAGNTLFSDFKVDSKEFKNTSKLFNSSMQEKSLELSSTASKSNSLEGCDQSKTKTVNKEFNKKSINCMLDSNEGSAKRENPLMIEDSTNSKASYPKKATTESKNRKDQNNACQTLSNPISYNDWSKPLKLFDGDNDTKANSNQVKENPSFSYASDNLRLFSG